MSSDNNDDRRYNDEQNPFILFRRFADDQFNALFRGVMDIPYMMSSMRQDFEKAERDLWKSFSDSYERSMNPERRQIQRDCQDVPDSERNEAFTSEDQQKHHMDRRSRFSACRRRARACGEQESERLEHQSQNALKQADEAEEVLRAWMMPSQDTDGVHQKNQSNLDAQRSFGESGHGLHPRGPLSFWLYWSRYSPLALERQKLFEEDKNKWRDAFEDLILVERGQAPLKREEKATGRANSDNPESWFRNVLGEHGEWPHRSLQKHGNIAKDEPKTELEMYEQFLGRQAPSAASFTKPEPQKELTLPKSSPSPSIMSQVTNTHSRTTPDGKVVTTTTFTRKFTDGSEDTRKTVTESFKDMPKGSPQPEKPALEAPFQKAKEQVTNKSRDRNWFWSS